MLITPPSVSGPITGPRLEGEPDLIKRWALRASAFHFLFHAEGRVTPGRGGSFARRELCEEGALRGGSFGTEACAGGACAGGRLGFLLLWRDGRVAPGWAFCLVTFAWRALEGVGCWVLGVGCLYRRRRRGLRTGYFARRLCTLSNA